MKVKVSVLIDQTEYERAKKNGVNVSAFLSNQLKSVNDLIEQSNGQKLSLTGVSFTKEKPKAGGEGFEPSTPNLGDIDFWLRYREFLVKRKYRGGYDSTLFNYAQKYGECLFSGDLSRVRDLPVGLRPNVLKALASLAKFSGRYDTWKAAVTNYKLGWGGRSGDDIIIDRLTNVGDPGEIWNWIKLCKDACPRLENFFDLMAMTGLRFIEAFNSYNLIIDLSDKGELDNYYRGEALEHFRFKEIFLRDTKKAFVSFCPGELVKTVTDCAKLPSLGCVKKLIQKRGLPLRFGDIREAQNTFMTKFLKPAEIDFLAGRVSSSVFMSNYFNPALIVDLKQRVFLGIEEIKGKVKIT